MNNKELRSVEQVKRLLTALGYQFTRIEAVAPPRPDVFADVDGRRISIETTDYHGYEKEKGGSPLRREEERDIEAGRMKAYWGAAKSEAGLTRRISEKTAKSYDVSDANELWLAIFAGVPQLGAVASTFLPTIFLNLDELNKQTISLLENSQFSRCYLFCELTENGPKLYCWIKDNQWHEIKIANREPAEEATLSFWDIQQLLKGSGK